MLQGLLFVCFDLGTQGCKRGELLLGAQVGHQFDRDGGTIKISGERCQPGFGGGQIGVADGGAYADVGNGMALRAVRQCDQ